MGTKPSSPARAPDPPPPDEGTDADVAAPQVNPRTVEVPFEFVHELLVHRMEAWLLDDGLNRHGLDKLVNLYLLAKIISGRHEIDNYTVQWIPGKERRS